MASQTPKWDVPPLYTYLWVQLRDSSHIIVKMDPIESTKLCEEFNATLESGKQTLLRIPCPDTTWQMFQVPSSSVAYLRFLDAAKGEYIVQQEKETYEKAAEEQRLRQAGFDIKKAGGVVVVPK